MRDNKMTKAELSQEVDTLRKRLDELRQTEETLRETEEKWRSLLNNTPDIVMIVDRDSIIRFINHTVPGITLKEATGKKIYDYISAEHHEKMRKDLEQIFQTGQICSHEISGVGPHGNLSWYRADLGPIKQDGRIVAASIVTRDITKHKEADQNLEAAKEHAELIYRVVPSAIFAVDKERRITDWNNKATEITGYTAEEVLGKECTTFALKPCCYKCGLYSDDVKKPVIAKECTIKTKDGEILTVLKNADFLKDINGNIIGGIESFEDTSERKRAEDVLRESEKRYRALFQGAAEGIIVADVETMEFKYVNPAICKMLGYSEEELKRLDVRDIHRKENLEYVISEFKAQARREKISSPNIPCLRKDRKIIYADIHTTNLLIDGRECNVGFFTDVTERKKAEDALRENENKYRTLLVNLPQKIFLRDKKSVYISCNENFARDLKITPEEITGKRDSDFFPGKLARQYRLDDKQIVESGDTREIDEKYIEDGQERIVHTIKTPVKDAKGNVIGILGIFWDVTELRKAEEELSVYREKMAHAEQLASLGTLSATLAHELNQPLTAIRLSIENSLADLETISCPVSVTEDLKDGLTGVSDVASIVKRFSNIARKSSGKIVNEVNLKAVAERIVRLLNESARRARVGLQLKGMEKPPAIYSNEKDLEQLFFALIENAIQAADGKRNRRLIISGGVKDERIELQFADTCGGITPENLDRIFEPFFTTRPLGEGTGLGLCIVERIVSGAGGKIRVENKAGKGSTFFITLPIKAGRRS
jgi:PAS domain S-box-containing protein